MFTKIATLTLAVAFLSAGAFAGARDLTAGSSVSKTVNMTVVSKNQNWPVRGQTTVDACKLAACFDI
jgi:outer membrane lipoprotein-sorting protein